MFKYASIAFALLATPALAASYDGTYKGVSSARTGCMNGTTSTTPPPPLVITGATVRLSFESGMLYQGEIAPTGSIRAHNQYGVLLVGQIDPSGKITGGAAPSGSCSVIWTWQR